MSKVWKLVIISANYDQTYETISSIKTGTPGDHSGALLSLYLHEMTNDG